MEAQVESSARNSKSLLVREGGSIFYTRVNLEEDDLREAEA